MKSSKLIGLLKKGNFVVPLYLFQLREKFSLSLEEFIFLIYLTNLGDKVIFNPERFSDDLSLPLEQVMVYVDSISEKGYVSVDVIKNEKGIMEEYIVLDLFYEKVSSLVLDDFSEEEETPDVNVFSQIEEGFGRTLTSIEYEIIKSWLESGVSEELILAALKETVFNGVNNLRYMDKILYEWGKKGIKTQADVDKNQQKFREEKKESTKLELFDFNWLEDEDE